MPIAGGSSHEQQRSVVEAFWEWTVGSLGHGAGLGGGSIAAAVHADILMPVFELMPAK